jgi:hypothetical protein
VGPSHTHSPYSCGRSDRSPLCISHHRRFLTITIPYLFSLLEGKKE